MRKIFYSITLFCYFACSSLSAQDDKASCLPTYEWIVDPYFSMRMGSADLISCYQTYIFADNYLLKQLTPSLSSYVGITLRFAEMLLIDFPAANVTSVVQHEVFGHGARAREEGLAVSYHIDWPIPYGAGGGHTEFKQPEKLEALPLQKQIGIVTGGIEGTERLGRDLVLRRLDFETMLPQESLLYLLSYHDATEYIFGTGREEGSGDIALYVDLINDYYQKPIYTTASLKKRAFINFVDPLFYTSLRSLWCYIVKGTLEDKMPLLSLGPLLFLPGLRLNLAPYGVEYGLSTYFLYYNNPGFFSLRFGRTDGLSSFGCGLEMPEVVYYGRYSFGGRLDLWWQPKLFVPREKVTSGLGGRFALVGKWQWTDTLRLYAEIGIKSRGYLMAEPLDNNLDFKLGIFLF